MNDANDTAAATTRIKAKESSQRLTSPLNILPQMPAITAKPNVVPATHPRLSVNIVQPPSAHTVLTVKDNTVAPRRLGKTAPNPPPHPKTSPKAIATIQPAPASAAKLTDTHKAVAVIPIPLVNANHPGA